MGSRCCLQVASSRTWLVFPRIGCTMADPRVTIVIGWLADNPPEFNVYLPCQLQVKLIGTPSAPYARRLGSVRQSKADLPGPSVRRAWESPYGGIFESTDWDENMLLEEYIVSIDLTLYPIKFWAVSETQLFYLLSKLMYWIEHTTTLITLHVLPCQIY